jgi:site-specific DNA recombinase
MTTGEGPAFAHMLAVFGELEAAAISDRNSSARRHLIQTDRVAGGALAYGWVSILNPSGPGLVLAKDPVCTK